MTDLQATPAMSPETGAARVSGLFRDRYPEMVRLADLLGADDPEDIAQEAFARLIRKAGSLRDPAAAIGYVRATVCKALADRAAQSPIDPGAWEKTVARARLGLRLRLPRWLPAGVMIPAAAAAAVVGIVLSAATLVGTNRVYAWFTSLKDNYLCYVVMGNAASGGDFICNGWSGGPPSEAGLEHHGRPFDEFGQCAQPGHIGHGPAERRQVRRDSDRVRPRLSRRQPR